MGTCSEARDHQRDNVERMRKIQAAFKVRQQEKVEQKEQQQQALGIVGRSGPLRAVHPKYDDVKAKIDTHIRREPSQVGLSFAEP